MARLKARETVTFDLRRRRNIRANLVIGTAHKSCFFFINSSSALAFSISTFCIHASILCLSLFLPLNQERKSRELHRRCHPKLHYVFEGVHLSFVNHWILESFIGGIPTESALRIRGRPSEFRQSVGELHRRNPYRIGITYQRDSL